jgi:aryl-alcohol dehydrogenase-like predicted oxidoreductase
MMWLLASVQSGGVWRPCHPLPPLQLPVHRPGAERTSTNDLRRVGLVRHLGDERRLDAVEQLVPLAAEAGLPMTHLAMAFTIAHPAMTSALLDARTMDHLDGQLAGLDGTLTDHVLDRIDEIVPPGTDVANSLTPM